MPPALQRREHHEQVSRSVALVLIIMPSGVSWLHRDRHAGFGDELLGCLIQTDHGSLRVVRPPVDFQYIFHTGYEGGVGVWRDDPLLLKVRFENVFLASARSCCRWRGQQCLVPRLRIPAASASTGRGPWADRNKPTRSAWPRLLHRRWAFWLKRANACGSGRTRSLPPPVAAGSGQPC